MGIQLTNSASITTSGFTADDSRFDMAHDQLDTHYKKWSIRQIVHHLADSHAHSYIRFKWAMTEDNAMRNELGLGIATIESGETVEGATRFRDGQGRHGEQ